MHTLNVKDCAVSQLMGFCNMQCNGLSMLLRGVTDLVLYNICSCHVIQWLLVDREYFSCFDIIIMLFYLVNDDWLELTNVLFVCFQCAAFLVS